jgi:hypothetical protein
MALSAHQWWLVVRAFVGLGIVELGLRVHALPRLVDATNAREAADEPGATPDQLHRAREYARLVRIASRFHPVPAKCLHRSLVLHRWLAQEGVASTLRIGVKKAGTELTAHAWVEIDGHPVNDSPADLLGFVPLAHGRGKDSTWSRAVDLSRKGLRTPIGAGAIEWR